MLESGKERLLIIAPHADDEVLGCGGLIEKACRYDHSVKVVIGAVGDTKFDHQDCIIPADVRKKELSDAMDVLGCKDYEILYEDKEALMDTISQKELVTKIDQLLQFFLPSMVFIPYPSFHQDHQALFNACMASLRPMPSRKYKLIAMYEYPLIVWQYPKLRDVGEMYLDITETIEKKVDSLRKHLSQIREDDHLISPSNVKKWAEMRGLEAGCSYAEKYYILRANL